MVAYAEGGRENDTFSAVFKPSNKTTTPTLQILTI